MWPAHKIYARRLAVPIAHRRLLFWVNIGLKALFVGLLAFGAFSGLDQFDGKGFGWRLVFYPIAVLIVPVVSLGAPAPGPAAVGG